MSCKHCRGEEEMTLVDYWGDYGLTCEVTFIGNVLSVHASESEYSDEVDERIALPCCPNCGEKLQG